MKARVLQQACKERRCLDGLALFYLIAGSLIAADTRAPLHHTADLSLGEMQEVKFGEGASAKVKLLNVTETRDALRGGVRRAEVRVEVNGVVTNLVSGNYHLPVTLAGVQIDCPVTRGYRDQRNHRGNVWALEKDARLRIWPAGSPWLEPGSLTYPLKQRWFASLTQMGNEPTYVDGGDDPANQRLYYHAGCDLGGCEGRAEVVAASDGLVVFAHGTILSEYADLPFHEQLDGPDLIFILEAHGWIHRYAHLRDVDPAVRAGQRVRQGQRLGWLGKEGGSGGWSHLHFDIRSRQPSGRWGHQDGYAFLWEAYQREYQPKLLAIARPHHLVATGEKVLLDGSQSWSAAGKIESYEWIFGDGSSVRGPKAGRTYERPGSYCETLKATDGDGREDYDFSVVQVIDKSQPDKLPPTIHVTYAPTFGIKPEEPVTFAVRTFRTQAGKETWDFGDGSPAIETHSDGNADAHAPDGYAATVHRYKNRGSYLVRVERTGHTGAKAVARLHVRVGEDSEKQAAEKSREPRLAAAVARSAPAPASPGDETPFVNPFFMLSGALLTDSFDGPELDATLWSRPSWLADNHKTIGVKIENGHLVISGPSHPAGGSHQYAGVISKYFRDTDVVLAADMQAQSPIKGEGRIQHMVHLCSGDYPDFFTEIIFGKIAAVEPPRWHTAYLDKVWVYSGHGKYLEPTRPATGSEASQWHTVVLVHDGTTSKTQNYLMLDEQWIPVGPPHTVRFNHTHIELKVDANIPDLPIEMAVDNVRLYPNPAHNPVTIVVGGAVSGGRPALPIHNQKVQIFDESSKRLLGEALTDEGGEARVSLRTDVLYPVAAAITVWDGTKPVVQSKIPRKAVSGLYPGDVWALDLRHRQLKKQ